MGRPGPLHPMLTPPACEPAERAVPRCGTAGRSCPLRLSEAFESFSASSDFPPTASQSFDGAVLSHVHILASCSLRRHKFQTSRLKVPAPSRCSASAWILRGCLLWHCSDERFHRGKCLSGSALRIRVAPAGQRPPQGCSTGQA